MPDVWPGSTTEQNVSKTEIDHVIFVVCGQQPSSFNIVAANGIDKVWFSQVVQIILDGTMENIIVVQLEEITDISCRQWTADGVEDKFDHSVKTNPTSDLVTFGYIFIDNGVVDISEVVISQLIINFC